MDRRKRAAGHEAGQQASTNNAGTAGGPKTCAVCGAADARLLVDVELEGGVAATLCGSHALLHSRTDVACRSVTELREALGERREMDRRSRIEGDELAERLTAAFTRERRGSERRAN